MPENALATPASRLHQKRIHTLGDGTCGIDYPECTPHHEDKHNDIGCPDKTVIEGGEELPGLRLTLHMVI